MKILLAGYNVDHDVLKEFCSSRPGARDLTPETISAAYARISRSPRSVDELRTESRAEVEKARRSNRNIVFDMGHSSIAEHAVFNIDILGVSRLLVEEIERFRLCSYTEKSQRYVLFRDDFTVPDEIRGTAAEDSFVAAIREQYRCYHDLYERLQPYVLKRYRGEAAVSGGRSALEGLAKEDARYAIALATQTQLGMTANARNAELMIRRLAASPLAEARLCAGHLFDVLKGVAPSLVRYTEATDYDRLTRGDLREAVDEIRHRQGKPGRTASDRQGAERPAVSLIEATPEADEKVLALMVFSSSDLPMDRCRRMVKSMNAADRANFFRAAFGRLRSHDAVLREFERAELTFELVVSASCFAQLKRHRMATIISQEYDPVLGLTVPPSIREVGMEDRLRGVAERAEDLYRQLRKEAPSAAAYILTNAHRRRVVLKINAREMYHLCRLRTDRHAQWDIRNVAEEMNLLARKRMPLIMMMATGKDGFEALRSRALLENTNP
ncbi:MAG TPA: FAD-dependent thymidylate synthase [Syntrophales bacterium]|nr:FAD-dependent thymidylate synthase [Syntrophales bacterium]